MASRIDFISAYCDRWCDRCAFTDRCSAFACTLAIGMCGDFADGLALAVGAPPPIDGTSSETAESASLADFSNVEPSADEMAKFERDEKARRARLDHVPLHGMSKTYGLRSWMWLKEHHDTVATHADPIVREALEVVAWDAMLIGAILHRALAARDRSQHDEGEWDDHPVQNDSNGSAKVALISIERSEAAWRVIAAATKNGAAAILADAAAHLRRTAQHEFPRAMSFVRPGLDEPSG